MYMNMRKAMLLKLGSLQFSLWELHLYLDTHPMDAAAEARYMGYKKPTMKSELNLQRNTAR